MPTTDRLSAIRGLINDLTRSLTASFVHLDNSLVRIDKNTDTFADIWLANEQLERSLELFLELRSLYLLIDLDKILFTNNKINIVRDPLIHNLNNLLTVIVGCCDIMYEKGGENKIRENIETIYKEMGKMQFLNLENLNHKHNSHNGLKNIQKFRSDIHSRHILLVEDDEIVREVIFNALKIGGYNLIQCENGKNAMVEFQTHSSIVDVCLIDYELPDMNGCKLVEQILSIRNNVNIIFMSGYNDIEITMTKSSRKFPLIRKPFKLHYIIEQIDRALNQFN